ncbi:MAG: hypothetical protein RIR52_545, partial [Acidobacteriota bacterium]
DQREQIRVGIEPHKRPDNRVKDTGADTPDKFTEHIYIKRSSLDQAIQCHKTHR